jgi:hypothetical protein
MLKHVTDFHKTFYECHVLQTTVLCISRFSAVSDNSMAALQAYEMGAVLVWLVA